MTFLGLIFTAQTYYMLHKTDQEDHEKAEDHILEQMIKIDHWKIFCTSIRDWKQTK